VAIEGSGFDPDDVGHAPDVPPKRERLKRPDVVSGFRIWVSALDRFQVCTHQTGGGESPVATSGFMTWAVRIVL
jgi:hypothetical protein